MSLRSRLIVGPDPKPEKRIIDPGVFADFYAQDHECLVCGERNPQAHHMLSRAQGGDDLPGNLLPLCKGCHGAFHGNPYLGPFCIRITRERVELVIAKFLRSEAGVDHATYLTRKMGGFAAEAFVQKLEGRVRL